MTRYTGKDMVVMVDNSGGTPTALTNIVACDLTFEHEENETRGSAVAKAALAGQLVTRLEVEYEWDDTATTGNHALLGGILGNNTTTSSIAFRPYGSSTGRAEFLFEAVLLSYGNPSVNREGKLAGRAVFVHHANATDTPAWAAQS